MQKDSKGTNWGKVSAIVAVLTLVFGLVTFIFQELAPKESSPAAIEVQGSGDVSVTSNTFKGFPSTIKVVSSTNVSVDNNKMSH